MNLREFEVFGIVTGAIYVGARVGGPIGVLVALPIGLAIAIWHISRGEDGDGDEE